MRVLRTVSLYGSPFLKKLLCQHTDACDDKAEVIVDDPDDERCRSGSLGSAVCRFKRQNKRRLVYADAAGKRQTVDGHGDESLKAEEIQIVMRRKPHSAINYIRDREKRCALYDDDPELLQQQTAVMQNLGRKCVIILMCRDEAVYTLLGVFDDMYFPYLYLNQYVFLFLYHLPCMVW